MRTRYWIPLTLFQFRSLYRNKVAFFFNLILPLAFVAVFGAMFTGGTPAKTDVGLTGGDGGAATLAFRQAMDRSALYEVHTGDADLLQTQLQQGKLKALVVLPPDLSSSVAAGRPAQVTIWWDKAQSSAAPAVGSLQNLVARVGVALSGAQPVLAAEVKELPDSMALKPMDFLLPGQVAYALLSAGLMTVALAIANARQSGSLRHLFSTPLSIGAYTATRLLANVVMALVQITILYTAAVLLYQVHLPANPGATLVVLLGSAVASVGMGMAIGALTRGADQAFPLAMALYMALAFLGGAMMPLDAAPAIVRALSPFMPTYWMTHGLRLVMMQGKGLGAVTLDLTILGATALVLLPLSVWRMRRQFISAA